MTVRMIWAQSRNQVIGSDGKIPWHVPEDLKMFRSLTMGSTVLMGRKTWESLSEAVKPLPGRKNIVVTRKGLLGDIGATVVSDLEGTLSYYRDSGEDLWVIGGGQIYQDSEPWAEEAYVSVVDTVVCGDTYAPSLTPPWSRVSSDDLGSHRLDRYIKLQT